MTTKRATSRAKNRPVREHLSEQDGLTLDDDRASNRPQRVSLDDQNLIVAEERAGYKRLYQLELPGIITKMQLAGWSVVFDGTQDTSDDSISIESQLGSPVRRILNFSASAEVKWGTLMEIPLEIFNIDQDAKQRKLDEQEESYLVKGESSIEQYNF